MSKVVYVARLLGRPDVYKVGISENPKHRRYGLKSVVGAVEFIHTIATNNARRLELYLHVVNRDWHVEGELFRLPPDVLRAICRTRSVTFTRQRDARAIRFWRQDKGWSRSELQRRLDFAYDTVRLLEEVPHAGFLRQTIVAVADLMGVTPESLV